MIDVISTNNLITKDKRKEVIRMTFAIQKHSLRLDTQKYTAKDILDEEPA